MYNIKQGEQLRLIVPAYDENNLPIIFNSLTIKMRVSLFSNNRLCVKYYNPLLETPAPGTEYKLCYFDATYPYKIIIDLEREDSLKLSAGTFQLGVLFGTDDEFGNVIDREYTYDIGTVSKGYMINEII